MSIIQDQQLIESLSDQDLARLIQGEIPQLAHLASVGVSETTRRLDFRREYQEELDRLDNPLGKEDISTQMAMKLLSGGVPTVNGGVTDEFPQGGIAGPQQAAPQAAAPQQGAAPQAAAPQAAPAAAPAAGGQVPGMQLGGSLRDRLVEDDLDIEALQQEALQAGIPWEVVVGALLKPAWNVGKKHILPKAKEVWGGIKNLYGRRAKNWYDKAGEEVLEKTNYPVARPSGEIVYKTGDPIARTLSDREIGRRYARHLGTEIGASALGGGAGYLGSLLIPESGGPWDEGDLLIPRPGSDPIGSSLEDWLDVAGIEEKMPGLGGVMQEAPPWTLIDEDPPYPWEEQLKRREEMRAGETPAGAIRDLPPELQQALETAGINLPTTQGLSAERLQEIVDILSGIDVGFPSSVPTGTDPIHEFRRYMEEQQAAGGITPEYDKLLKLLNKNAALRRTQGREGIGQLSDIVKRFGGPGAGEQNIEDFLGLRSLTAPGMETAMSLADIATAIGGNVMPGDLGKGLAQAAKDSVQRLDTLQTQDFGLRQQSAALQEAREVKQDELRMKIYELQTANESEYATKLEEIARIRQELAQAPQQMWPQYLEMLENRRLGELDLRGREAQVRAQLMGPLLQLLGGGMGDSNLGPGPEFWRDPGEVLPLYISSIEAREAIGGGPESPGGAYQRISSVIDYIVSEAAKHGLTITEDLIEGYQSDPAWNALFRDMHPSSP